MFPRISFVVLVCALAAGLVGCEPAAVKSLGYAQVVPGPTFQPDNLLALPRVPAPARKDGPLVRVEARFIWAAPASMTRQFDLQDGQTTKTLVTEQARQSVIALQEDPCTRTLTAPRMTLFPGQKAFVAVRQERGFVRDEAFKPGMGTGAGFKLVVDKLSEGTKFTVAAEIEGGQVVLTHLEPVTSNVVAIRNCAATVAWAGKLRDTWWEEPLLMEGTGPMSSPCRIALQPDQTLLVRLKYGLRQSTGSIRLYARGPVRETLEMCHSAPDQQAVAETETALLIQARIVQPPEQPTTVPAK